LLFLLAGEPGIVPLAVGWVGNLGKKTMNWIKVRTHLISHPHVVRIASALCLPCVHVFGALVHMWSVADSHADGDLLKNMTPAALDRLTETPGLTAELASVGWIVVREDGLQLVNYQQHNGASAKRRALEAKRKKGVRIESAECPQDVRIECGQDADLEKNKNRINTKKKETEEPDTSGIILSYPTNGAEPQYHLRENQLHAWSAVYPSINVLQECQKAMIWLQANQSNRKTAAGMPRFLVNWLNRATNQPKPTRGSSFFDRPPERKPRPLASEMMPPELAAEIFGEAKPAERLEVRHG
jgi:hypothetical protein